MKDTSKTLIDAGLYLVVFILIQVAATLIMNAIFGSNAGDATPSVVASLLSSIATIALFAWRKWSPVTRQYINTRPWDTLFWTAMAAMGLSGLSSCIEDVLPFSMPEALTQLYVNIMNHPLGYITIGLVVPVAEEMVFRGAILRTLLQMMGTRRMWWAIAISALLFGVAHGNMVQGCNAFIVGLLIGWLYCRTGSIVPGVVLHWMNNTMAYVMFKLMPGSADMTVSEMFGGDMRKVAIYVACAVCVLLPSLYQLNMRAKRA